MAETLVSYALMALNDLKLRIGISTSDTTYDTVLTNIINGTTAIIETACNRRFASTSYTNEKYDGDGTNLLFLKNYPVTVLTRLAIGTDNPIKIKNTYEYTTASVSVTSSSIILTRDGATDGTLTFASYATMTTMVAAVNAVGSNWEAQLTSGKWASYKSSELLIRMGASAIYNNWVDLQIPAEAEDDFEVYEDKGCIYSPLGFPKGRRNIFVSYTAGDSTIPYDIRELALLVGREFWNLSQNEGGKKGESIGNYSYSIDQLPQNIQDQIKELRDKHKKINMGN
ncbi:MAG: hypothetical protein ACFFG0_04655 [Candidatus Thorarchaeota archaeon]